MDLTPGQRLSPFTSIKQPLSVSPYESFERCSIENLRQTGYYFLDTATPIAVEEFDERRNRLARALVADGADAFVVEPGYTFKYYANVSQPEWEVWEVSALSPQNAICVLIPLSRRNAPFLWWCSLIVTRRAMLPQRQPS